MVGPGLKRRAGSDDPFLIVHRGIVHGADPRGNNQEPFAELFPKPGRFQPGRNHARASRLQRATGAGKHQFSGIAGKPQIGQIALVEAGEHGNRKNFHAAPRFHRRLHNPLVSVNGGKLHRTAFQCGHSALHGLWYIEKLEIDKDLLPARSQPVEQFEIPARHEQLQPNLVKTNGVPKRLDEGFGFIDSGNIESENQAFRRRNRFIGKKLAHEKREITQRQAGVKLCNSSFEEFEQCGMVRVVTPLLRTTRAAAPVALLLALLVCTALIRVWNRSEVFVAGKTFFVDADCYSRMTRVRQVMEHPFQPIHRHSFENWPEGVAPHTTAPFDYLTVALAWSIHAIKGCEPQVALDLAGAFISPLLGMALVAFLWFWSGRLGQRHRAAMLILFATSPILVHGTVLGRPDHQSLLLVCMAVALGAEVAVLGRGIGGWAGVASVAWGLGLWVSFYEPAILLAAVLIFSLSNFRKRGGWRGEWGQIFRYRFAGIAVMLLIAALVDDWRWPLPNAEVIRYFPNWSKTIGELVRVPAFSPVFLRWTLLFLPLSPVLLLWHGRRGERSNDRDGALFWLWLLGLTFVLTCWQVRWGYFLSLVFTMSLPSQLSTFRTRWIAPILFAVGLWPVAQEWNSRLFPSDAELGQRTEQRLDNLALDDVAAQLRGPHRLPILAPWWQSPALAYWSGQPCVAGSSHESLPGIVDACRFYTSEDPREAEAVLARRKVACVIAYEPTRVIETARTVLGIKPISEKSGALPLGDPSERAMGVLLFRRPHSPPPFLQLAYGNLAFRVFLRAEGVESK